MTCLRLFIVLAWMGAFSALSCGGADFPILGDGVGRQTSTADGVEEVQDNPPIAGPSEGDAPEHEIPVGECEEGKDCPERIEVVRKTPAFETPLPPPLHPGAGPLPEPLLRSNPFRPDRGRAPSFPGGDDLLLHVK